MPAAPLGYSLARNNVSADIARKIAFRHRKVKELYNTFRNNVVGKSVVGVRVTEIGSELNMGRLALQYPPRH